MQESVILVTNNGMGDILEAQLKADKVITIKFYK